MRLVLGFGNAWRGDDGAGPAVIERLRARGAARAAALGAPGPELFERWGPADRVALVDAVVSGAAPGTIHRLDALRAPLPAGLRRLSTHGGGLGEALELARALERLPAELTVYAIEGATFEAGQPLSPAVAAAVAQVADELREEGLEPCTRPG